LNIRKTVLSVSCSIALRTAKINLPKFFFLDIFQHRFLSKSKYAQTNTLSLP
jgi:hypothetical protein